MQAKYVNPFTDFGFKKLFGEEASKPLLIDFLNALLPLKEKIISLSFKNTEQLGFSELDRKAVYDIYCESESGEKFIVELQKAKQNYFVDRTIYYSTFPIQEQAQKGDWNFNLKAVYCIGILDFIFKDYESPAEQKKVVHTVQLKNEDALVFYDKLTYIYLEMPNFTKTEMELSTRLDKWLYFLKHLDDFDFIPDIFRDVVFVQAFETAELAKMNDIDKARYQQSLKIARDNKNTFDYAMEQVIGEVTETVTAQVTAQVTETVTAQVTETVTAQVTAQVTEIVRLKEMAQVVKSARQMGLSIQAIAQLTGLTEEEISSIK